MENFMQSQVKNITMLHDFPPGPLDRYRKNASFDFKKMRLFLNPIDKLQHEAAFFKEIEKNPIFYNDVLTPSLDEIRRRAVKRTFTMYNMPFMKPSKVISESSMPLHTDNVIINMDPSTSIKMFVSFGMFTNALIFLGTSRHLELAQQGMRGDIIGCFALTEIGHGSNAKSMRTEARYNKETKEFILHTPDFEAAKCWVGALGQMATHIAVYAQLITPDGVNHGLHVFVAQIRDMNTLLPLPGIIVGDLGEKIGLNGIDNGFIMFDQFCVPHTALLNKTGDVTEEGKYVTPFKDPNKRHGASLGQLSIGRINITYTCSVLAIKALTIAIRYSAVRKQFGPDNQEEIPILEYQTHQNRLLPYLAYAYCIKIFSYYIAKEQHQFIMDSILGKDIANQEAKGVEIHAVSSATKPVCTWTTMRAIQESREACGGHGYLKVAGIGDIRNDHDANCTFEGEGHVLIQQTSNYLLKFWPRVLDGKMVTSPLKTINFLSDAATILGTKFTANCIEELVYPTNILHTYKWLICYLLQTTYNKIQTSLDSGIDKFIAKNDSQVFFARSLGIAFAQHLILEKMYKKIEEAGDSDLKKVLTKLMALYGIWALEQEHLVTMYEGGFANGSKPAMLIRDAILMLSKDIKDDAVSLIDAVAPPDIAIDSVLGKSDGMVYKHLQAAIFRNPMAMARPSWYDEIVNWKSYVSPKL